MCACVPACARARACVHFVVVGGVSLFIFSTQDLF